MLFLRIQLAYGGVWGPLHGSATMLTGYPFRERHLYFIFNSNVFYSIQLAYGGVWAPLHGSATVLTGHPLGEGSFFSGFEMASGLVATATTAVCEMNLWITSADGTTIK